MFAICKQVWHMFQLQFIVLVVVVVVLLDRVHCDVDAPEVVCQWDKWNATCPSDSVVVVDLARYGRMRLSRCVSETGYRSDGCAADVTSYADRLCSGRRRCAIPLPDPVLDRSPHGCGDLKSYLEISYHCLRVGPPQEIGRPKLKCTEPIKRLTSDGPVGYLAKVETVESNYGSSACPWIIEAAIGQTLTLTLVDFAISKDTDAPSDDRRSSGTMCTMYATIRETGSGLAGTTGPTTVCGGHPSKETKLFTSTTNTVQVTVVGSSAAALANIPYFLIKYEVNGCSDYIAPPNMFTRRIGDTVRVGCTEETLDDYSVRCVGNVWSTGGGGALPNCTLGGASQWWNSDEFHSTVLSRQGFLIVILVGVALVVVILILAIGLCWLCRTKAPPRRNGGTYDMSSLGGRQYAASHHSEMKEVYPMLSKQDRDQTTDWERDYATTLQMRQMAHPSSLGGHQPHCGGPGGGGGDPNYFHGPLQSEWFCAVHGPSCSEPPHTADIAPRIQRFSSFRPRSDHIYEVPRFENQDSYHDEYPQQPEFYHEMNNAPDEVMRRSGMHNPHAPRVIPSIAPDRDMAPSRGTPVEALFESRVVSGNPAVPMYIDDITQSSDRLASVQQDNSAGTDNVRLAV